MIFTFLFRFWVLATVVTVILTYIIIFITIKRYKQEHPEAQWAHPSLIDALFSIVQVIFCSAIPLLHIGMIWNYIINSEEVTNKAMESITERRIN